MFDLIIVGSGLYGAVTAYLAKAKGMKCLVLERRKEMGGNIRDEWTDGICVHQYGAHIFHTDSEDIWNFVNRLTPFNHYVHTVLAYSKGRLYHLPFSMQTLYEVYGISRPSQMQAILEEEHRREYYEQPTNLEEQAINLVGRRVYELLVKGYTEKQWGCKATELSPDIIRRLPIRQTFDNRYFSDRYQGVPERGYSHLIHQLLKGIDIRTGVDFCREREYWLNQARHVVYTGMVDELMDYELGELVYRGLRFETERLVTGNYQGAAVINEVSGDVPFTRTIEHKHFHYNTDLSHTIITREYPQVWKRGHEAYYPVNSERNNRLYEKYVSFVSHRYPSVCLGGRLGHYRYYDMDDAISAAMVNFTSIQKRISMDNPPDQRGLY